MLSLQVHHSIKLMLGNEDKVFPSRFLTLSKKVSILSNLDGGGGGSVDGAGVGGGGGGGWSGFTVGA